MCFKFSPCSDEQRSSGETQGLKMVSLILPGLLELIPTDLSVIIFIQIPCACPNNASGYLSQDTAQREK